MIVQIKITKHAELRAIQRGIRIKDVKRIVNNPLKKIYDERNKNFKSLGKAEDIYSNETKYLIIIHSGNTNNMIRVITCMWVEERRLNDIGFNEI